MNRRPPFLPFLARAAREARCRVASRLVADVRAIVVAFPPFACPTTSDTSDDVLFGFTAVTVVVLVSFLLGIETVAGPIVSDFPLATSLVGTTGGGDDGEGGDGDRLRDCLVGLSSMES